MKMSLLHVWKKSAACLFVILTAMLLQPASCLANDAIKQPNVVVILTDDQGWGDLSLHENPNLATPNIDAMARDGAEIDRFYVCAVCSPTRAEFLTGRYHNRSGVYSTSAGGERFNSDEQTIAEVFREGGYATGCYGKWHSGMQYPYHPNARGFDDYYGFCSGHWGNYYSPMLEHNGRLVKGDGFIVDDLTNRTIKFIDSHRDQPFFVYLALNTPHSPMQVPYQYWKKFADKKIMPDPEPANARKEKPIHTRAALAMCENIDANVGRLIQHLDSSGIGEDTIVIYFSDNGPNGARFNAGMRGRKGSTNEGGLRSPCIIRYPRRIKPGTKVNRIAGAIDLLPTLADFAGIKFDAPKPLDGTSITRLLMGDGDDWKSRVIFSAWNKKATVRDDRYRLQLTGGLYDIINDPREKNDLTSTRPEVVKRLKNELDGWLAETALKSSRDPATRPITLAHPEAEYTQLPSRDANANGGVRRSNRFPNCTFMTNWKTPEDSITWDVEVLGSGEYEVQMYYACKQADVGSKIELLVGDEKIEKTIEVANEVPLIGAAEDRFQRVEGYVRDWRPMTLGVVQLEPGKTTLTLRAREVAGGEVADMRLLLFRRLRSAGK
jgi:arylsulfatase A-like enzyme